MLKPFQRANRFLKMHSLHSKFYQMKANYIIFESEQKTCLTNLTIYSILKIYLQYIEDRRL